MANGPFGLALEIQSRFALVTSEMFEDRSRSCVPYIQAIERHAPDSATPTDAASPKSRSRSTVRLLDAAKPGGAGGAAAGGGGGGGGGGGDIPASSSVSASLDESPDQRGASSASSKKLHLSVRIVAVSAAAYAAL